MQSEIERVYLFICTYLETKGYAPSQANIAQNCYISAGSVVRYLEKLEMRGLIRREPGQARSIVVCKPDKSE